MNLENSIFFAILFFIVFINLISSPANANTEWQTYQIHVDNAVFKIPYLISNGEVKEIEYLNNSSVHVRIISDDEEKGSIIITLPRNLIDEKIGNKDVSFTVLVDGEETKSDEINTSGCFRTISIEFPPKAKQLEIIATYLNQPPKSTVPTLFLDSENDNYEPGDIVTFSGCTNLAENYEWIFFEIITPNGEIYKSGTITPNLNGTFSYSTNIDQPQPIDGNYTAKVTYGNNSATYKFVIPEFPFGVILALVFSTSLMIIINRGFLKI